MMILSIDLLPWSYVAKHGKSINDWDKDEAVGANKMRTASLALTALLVYIHMFSACFITASCIPLTSMLLTCSYERSAKCSSVIRIRMWIYSRQETVFAHIMNRERSYRARLRHHWFTDAKQCMRVFLAVRMCYWIFCWETTQQARVDAPDTRSRREE